MSPEQIAKLTDTVSHASRPLKKSEPEGAHLVLLGEPASRPAGLERALVRAGFTLSDPATFDASAESRAPELILVAVPSADWGLSTLLEQLGTRTEWRGIPRLVLLLDGAPGAVAAALKAGADDAVGPAAPCEEIIARIQASLRRRTGPAESSVGFVATELYSDKHAQSRFFARLTSEVSRATRYSLSFVLVRAGVADFEAKVARLGEAEAARQADEVAVILRSVLRVPDFSVRIGAAEFAIALPETDPAGASAFLARWRTALEHRLPAEPERFSVLAGLSALPQPVMPDAAELQRMAEHDLLRVQRIQQ